MAYVSINIEGGFLPADLLDRIAGGDEEGQRPTDFGLDRGGRLGDETQSAFSDARAYWDAFQRRLAHSRERTTTVTRESWVIPLLERLGFDLIYLPGATPAGDDTFNFSHRAGDNPDAPPVHIVALGQDLDAKPPGARRGPHATVQQFLNRTDALWGIVTNGHQLRLLRNSVRLARPSYLEFDLEGIIEGNQYSEFTVLYRLLHRTRFPRGSEDAAECWLERYYHAGIEQGGRVRERLREGVERAIEELGAALVSHPDSRELREQIASGRLDETGYYRELLRLVYRMLFLFVAEERRLLATRRDGHVPDVADALDVYMRYYALARLRDRCEQPFAGDRHVDLWQGLVRTFLIFRDEEYAKPFGLSALDGELFSGNACRDLDTASCENQDLLRALYHLSTFQDGTVRRRVNYAMLDVEELGSVYESLLDYRPVLTLEPSPSFSLSGGGERKQTGSYYTPPSLVGELIDSALQPVIDDRLANAGGDQQSRREALLSIRVLDPASGSGHFLLAAARRMAWELARIDTGEPEPSRSAYRAALREVIRTCLYAVDKNPMAVDLCKVALWIEGHDAGLPLSFLDHHIKGGDSLVGVMDLDVLDEGIPDDAYTRSDKDEKKAASYYRKRNREEKSKRSLFGQAAEPLETSWIAGDFASLSQQHQISPQDVQQVAQRYHKLREGNPEWTRNKLACDLWAYAFFAPLKVPEYGEGLVPTTDMIRRVLAGRENLPPELIGQATATASDVRFFHWPLEFPDVLDQGGFDVVLGNPPWERIKLQEKEFFAGRDPEIANAPNKAARGRLVRALKQDNPGLAREFTQASNQADAASRFARGAGRFPLGGRGDINTYVLFTELMHGLVGPTGRGGMIVPSGIATDDTTKMLFQSLMDSRSIASLYDFENRKAIFPTVHRSYKFCLLTLTGSERPITDGSWFAFFLLDPNQLRDPEQSFVLTPEDLRLLNPNTRTCPIFRTRRDAEITKAIYRRVPVLVDENNGEAGNPWGARMTRLVDINKNSESLKEADWFTAQGAVRTTCHEFEVQDDRWVRTYDGMMIDFFDHRFASVYTVSGSQRSGRSTVSETYQKHDPEFAVIPRYWMRESELRKRWSEWAGDWFLSYMDVCSTTNIRTMVPAIIPRSAPTYSLRIMQAGERPTDSLLLLANFSSFAFDYVARQIVGGLHLSDYIVRQLPVIPAGRYEGINRSAIEKRALELTYTAWDMQPFARDCGYDGPPFQWDDDRRFLLQRELDAAFFHLYCIERDDVDYVMETFWTVRDRDEAAHGEYRTKRVILEIYDAMADAIRAGHPYQTRLDPPPADSRAAYGAETERTIWEKLEVMEDGK